MENLDFQEIVRLLSPGEGVDILWSIFLYIIFFFALITLLFMPDNNMVATLMIATVMLMAIVAKVSIASSDPILRPREFGMMIINVLMGIFPFIVAGMVRVRTRKGKIQPPAIIGGIFGIVYFFLFWLFVQRG